MKIPEDAKLLRIFIGEGDRWKGKPLFEAIVQRARKDGLAGATVLKGFEGFGAHSRIHTAKILCLSENLPIVIEIVDSEEKIEAFVELCRPYGIKQLSRTGVIAVPRASQSGAPAAGNTRKTKTSQKKNSTPKQEIILPPS